MNKDIVKGHWNQVKGKITQQWGDITDDDLKKMKGSYEELAGTLQKKYGYDRSKAEKEIDQFLKKQNLN